MFEIASFNNERDLKSLDFETPCSVYWFDASVLVTDKSAKERPGRKGYLWKRRMIFVLKAIILCGAVSDCPCVESFMMGECRHRTNEVQVFLLLTF